MHVREKYKGTTINKLRTCTYLRLRYLMTRFE